MPLDLSKLTNAKPSSGGSYTFACPCCRLDGADHSGDHLIVYPDGRFGCLMHPRDKRHNRVIWQLAGDGTSGGGNGDDIQIENYDDPKVKMTKTWPIDLLDRLMPDYSYWEGRGISEETVKPFRGGVATEGQMKNRWILPQFGVNGEIIGFSGRCIMKLSKEDRKKYNRNCWKHLGEVKSYLWGDIEGAKRERTVILVESIGDVLACMENGVKGAISIFGTNLQERPFSFLISSRPKRIIIATNNDVKHSVGQKAAAKIESQLLKFFNRETVQIYLPTAKDFGEMTEENWIEWKKGLDAE